MRKRKYKCNLCSHKFRSRGDRDQHKRSDFHKQELVLHRSALRLLRKFRKETPERVSTLKGGIPKFIQRLRSFPELLKIRRRE